MAVQLCDNITQIPFAGQHGNLNNANDGKTLAAAAIADTIDFVTIPAASKIVDAHMVNAALGASTTVSLGWRYKDGTAGGSATAILAATSTVAAARTNMTAAPITPTLPKDIVVYGTIACGAATGRIDLVVKYQHLGAK